MISRQRIEDHVKLYHQSQIPLQFANRIVYISNAIPQHSVKPGRTFTAFTIVYSGRPGPEKRIHLILRIAKELNKLDKDVHFEMMGDLSTLLNKAELPFITFHGNVDDNEKINAVYGRAHLLLLTSTTEGFPMVIIEAMANGCAIMATPVGDIPLHIKDNENGFLFSTVDNEAAIIEEAVEKINLLKNNPEQWAKISATNMRYARDQFGIEKFNAAYRELLK